MAVTKLFLLMGTIIGVMTTWLSVSFRDTLSSNIYVALASALLVGGGFYIVRLRKLLSIREKRLQSLQARTDKIVEHTNKFVMDRIVELRRPLQGMVGIHDLYARSESPLEARDYVDIADFCSRFLIRQLERIQLFTEMEGGRIRFDKTSFSLRKCIDDAISMASEQANAKDVAIIEEWSPFVPTTVEGNEQAIRKIIVELLDNSIRYGGNGRIYLRIMPDPDHSSQFRFIVSDTGPGLAEKQINKLNSPLLRPRKANPWVEAQGGMGHYIVKKLIHVLGGHLTVDSRSGMGTTISFVLPEKSLSPATKMPEPINTQITKAPLVLVVDDEPVSRQIICSILKKLGISAEVAENGHQAIELCQQVQFDVVFMDLTMPVLDGFDASRVILHELKIPTKPKIIAVSSHCKQEDRDRCTSLGISDFLAKPARLEHIRESLQKLGFLSQNEVLSAHDQKPDLAVPKTPPTKNKYPSRPKSPGYYIDFNKLYNSLDENLTLCYDILKQVSRDLETYLENLATALKNEDKKELFAILHKVHGELTMVLCPEGIRVVQEMEAALRLEGMAASSEAFENLSETFENIINEIDGMTLTENLVA